MRISFYCVQVEYGLITCWQLPDQFSQFFYCQVDIRMIITYRMKSQFVKTQVQPRPALLFEIIDGCIHHNLADPCSQFTIRFELMEVLENFDKPFLENIFSIRY